MRLSAVFLFATCLQVSAKGFSQISIKEKNEPLQKVLSKIQKQSGYDFFYAYELIQGAGTVSVSLKNVSLERAMDECLKGKELTYEIVEKTVVIKKKAIVPSINLRAVPDKVVLDKIALDKIKVEGKVVNDKGEPLAGVSVVIIGTERGTTTDANGTFSIDAEVGQTIEFSAIGFTKASRKVINGKNIITISLQSEVSDLKDVIVVGYGTVKKKDLTGSVASVKAEVFKERPLTSLEDALQGNVSGLQIQSSGGQPGAAAKINIRGIGSLSGSTQPLVVVDGFPLFEVSTSGGGGLESFSNQMSSFSFINPDDIESIEVLKDASATAIYGNRGANGVILITTKKGRSNAPQFHYSFYSGIHQPPPALETLSAKDYIAYVQLLSPTNKLYTNPVTGKPYDLSNVESIKWHDQLYRRGSIQNHSISFQGGKDNTRFLLSGSYLQDKSIIIETDFKKANLKLSVDHKLSNNFKIGSDIGYNYIINDGVPTDGREGTAYGAVIGAQIALPFKTDRKTKEAFLNAGVESVEVENFFTNYLGDPENLARNTTLTKNLSRFLGNFYFDWTFLPGLSFRATFGADMYNGKDQQFYPPSTPWGFLTKGSAIIASFLNRSWFNDNVLTYSKQINNLHKINIVAGASLQASHWEYLRAENNTFANTSLGYNQVASASSFRNVSDIQDTKLIGFLFRANYTFKDKLNFTLSGRRDGTSRFLTGKWGNFYSGAVAYNLDEEKFIKDLDFISTFKLRGSFGETGNANVSTFGAFAQLRSTNYNFNGVEVSGQSPANFANKSLSWETSQQLNAGLDLSFFDNKISFTADYYLRKTKDLILSTAIINLSGFSGATLNVGEIQNSGFEFSLNTINIKTKKFEWNSSLVLTLTKNKINRLADDGNPISVNVNFDNIVQDEVLLTVGGPIGQLFGYVQDGIYKPEDFDTSGKLLVPGFGVGEIPGDVKFKDMNKDGKINTSDRVIIGNTQPKYFGSFTNNVKFGDFDFNCILQFTVGNDVFNATRTRTERFNGGENQSVKYHNRWTPKTPSSTQYARFPTIVAASTFVEDASFLRIRNLKLGYTIPKKILGKSNIKSLKVYVSVDNLKVFTKYSGYDPEVSSNQADGGKSAVLSSGFDYGGFPRAKTFLIGLTTDL